MMNTCNPTQIGGTFNNSKISSGLYQNFVPGLDRPRAYATHHTESTPQSLKHITDDQTERSVHGTFNWLELVWKMD